MMGNRNRGMRFSTQGSLMLLDLETTGVDPQQDLLLEISVAAVGRDLQLPSDPSAVVDSLVVHHDQGDIDACLGRPGGGGDFVRKMHELTGLWGRVGESTNSMQQVEDELLSFMDHNFGEGSDKILVAGNSVRFDLDFLRVNAPRVHERINKRIIDVSGMFEYLNWTDPSLLEGFMPAPGNHNSLNDLCACLNQMRHIDGILRRPHQVDGLGWGDSLDHLPEIGRSTAS